MLVQPLCSPDNYRQLCNFYISKIKIIDTCQWTIKFYQIYCRANSVVSTEWISYLKEQEFVIRIFKWSEGSFPSVGQLQHCNEIIHTINKY